MLKKSIILSVTVVAVVAITLFGISTHRLYSKKQLSVDPKLNEISGIEYDKRVSLGY